MTFLSRQAVTTVHMLRKQRFSLRQLVAAEHLGLLEVDVETGLVYPHTSTSYDGDPGTDHGTGMISAVRRDEP